MFLVELNASSFLDLISKQARWNAAVSAFLFENICYQYLNFVLRVTYCFFYDLLICPQSTFWNILLLFCNLIGELCLRGPVAVVAL